MGELKHWKQDGDVLYGVFKFKDFTGAFEFMSRVAVLQERHNHHAKIENMYNRVTLTLTTHDAGNTVTEKDWRLAGEIEALLVEHDYKREKRVHMLAMSVMIGVLLFAGVAVYMNTQKPPMMDAPQNVDAVSGGGVAKSLPDYMLEKIKPDELETLKP